LSILKDFPLISQQTPISWDGSSPNEEMDCVPTCTLAGLMYLLGIKQMNDEWNPDHILDEAYPEGYKGGTDAARFVSVCAKYGVKLFPVQGIPGALVSKIHRYLAQGCPCIITEPDPYVPSSYGWTHVLIAFADAPGIITFLDPWPGKPITKSDREWTDLLLNNEIWVMQKEEEAIVIDFNIPIIAQHFQASGSAWLCKTTSNPGKPIIIKDGMLAYYRNSGTKPYCGYSELGLPLSNEIALDDQGNTKQHFERGVLLYDPHGKYGPPAGAGAVYPAQLYDGGPGTDPALIDLEKQLQAAKAAQPQADPQAAQALTVVKQIKPLLGPF